jgi:hypothetical protein
MGGVWYSKEDLSLPRFFPAGHGRISRSERADGQKIVVPNLRNSPTLLDRAAADQSKRTSG